MSDFIKFMEQVKALNSAESKIAEHVAKAFRANLVNFKKLTGSEPVNMADPVIADTIDAAIVAGVVAGVRTALKAVEMHESGQCGCPTHERTTAPQNSPVTAPTGACLRCGNATGGAALCPQCYAEPTH